MVSAINLCLLTYIFNKLIQNTTDIGTNATLADGAMLQTLTMQGLMGSCKVTKNLIEL